MVRPDTASQTLIRIMHDIKALDSNIRLLAQQLKAVKRTERILARNIILLNRKVNSLREHAGGASTEGLDEIKSKLDRMEDQLYKLRDDVEMMKKQLQHVLTGDDLAELKYLIETINPLEFVTYRQVSELVEKKLKEHGVI